MIDQRRNKVLASLAALGLSLGLFATAAGTFAQQPPSGDRDPQRLPLGEVQPGQPGGPPGGQPGQPRRVLPPGGQPGQPGQRVPTGPRPPGGPRPMQPQPLRPAEPAAEQKSHAAAHCPGHGPMDSPHSPNWWQGIIGVDNDAAKFDPKPDAHGHYHRTDGFASQLLWRYEDKTNECDPKNQPPPFLASVLNFGLLAFILYRFGKKPLGEALAARKKAMMQEIDNATRLKNESETRLSELEDKLQHLDETLEQMKKDYVAQSEAERAHILAEAEERRARMRRDVEFRLEQELKAARQQLLQESVERAVVTAEELLKNKVGPADLDRSADELLTGLAAAWKSEGANAATRAQNAGGAA